MLIAIRMRAILFAPCHSNHFRNSIIWSKIRLKLESSHLSTSQQFYNIRTGWLDRGRIPSVMGSGDYLHIMRHKFKNPSAVSARNLLWNTISATAFFFSCSNEIVNICVTAKCYCWWAWKEAEILVKAEKISTNCLIWERLAWVLRNPLHYHFNRCTSLFTNEYCFATYFASLY